MYIVALAAMSLMATPVTIIAADAQSNKELCKDNGGDWEDGQCDFATDDEDKADKFSDEGDKIRAFEEERAAEEDALCDDEDAETTNIELCKSDDLTLGEAFASKEDKYDKKDCEADQGKWEDGECDHNCIIDGVKQEKGKEDWGVCD